MDSSARRGAAPIAARSLRLTASARWPLMIDVTVMGTVKRRQALTRDGARPGDELYVSGTIGAAAAGLRLLQSSVISHQSSVISHQSSVVSHQSSVVSQLSTEDCRLTTAFLKPEPRVRLGLALSRNRAASTR